MSQTLLATCETSAATAGISSPLHWRVTGINITYMVVTTVVYMTIAIVADFTLSSSCWRRLKYRANRHYGSKALPVESRAAVESDVATERERVSNLSLKDRDALSILVRNMSDTLHKLRIAVLSA